MLRTISPEIPRLAAEWLTGNGLLDRVSNPSLYVLRAVPPAANGADVLEFAKLEPKIFRTLVNEVHSSFRLLESLRIPTIASVQGMAVGGGFELALACDFLVVETSATLFSVEVMGGMLPGAGGIQRIADRLGRARTIRMMTEPISGEQAGALGIATHVVPAGELQKATTDLALKLSTGPTRAYAAIKGLMKAWSPGVAAADLLLSDLSADLYESKDAAAAWKGFA
jgi:enoyl-CoA hydratase/carnithine racemase